MPIRAIERLLLANTWLRRLSGRCLVAFGVVVGLGACDGAPPTQSDIVGAWTSSEGGELSFSPEGGVSVLGVPSRVILGRALGTKEKLSANGTWTLAENSSGWRWGVDLSLTSVPEGTPGFRTRVYVDGAGESMTLFRWVEDPGGARYEFRKEP
jgi:hypothetical protein